MQVKVKHVDGTQEYVPVYVRSQQHKRRIERKEKHNLKAVLLFFFILSTAFMA